MTIKLEDVIKFWDDNPLFSGESRYETGTKEFFEEHRNVYLNDCFSSKKALRKIMVPQILNKNAKILDLGCGVGFWTIELQTRSNKEFDFYSADISKNAVEITKKRLKLYGLKSELSVQNAEDLRYSDNYFDHINCQGVIHHTPDTQNAINEIARVLKTNGTAYISVYYKNVILRSWPRISKIVRFLLGNKGGLTGRGRESIFLENNIDEITRKYDGDKNPIGKSYSRKEIVKMVKDKFLIEEIFLNFFPSRALPFKIPGMLQNFLSGKMGFMIHLNLRKR